MSVVADGKVGDKTIGNFESWKIKKSAKIADLRENISDRNSVLENKKGEIESRINNQINELEKQINDQNEFLSQNKNNLNRLSSDRVEQNTDPKIKEIDNSLAKITSDLKELNKRFSSNQDNIQKSRKEERDALEEKIAKITAEVTKRKDTIPALIDTRDELKKTINEQTQELRIKAQDNQIYRFAQKWKGHDDILNVTDKELTIVSLVWYGSIALVCATIGTILALISNIMIDPDAFVEKQKKKSNNILGRSMRRLSLAFRKNC